MIKSILIIDDEDVWGALTKRMLAIEMPECTVSRAQDARTGLRLAKEVVPDVIILDVLLPEMNGWEIAAVLKADEITAAIPIIIASGAGSPYSDDPHIEPELIAAYIRKPFDVDTLLGAIRSVVGDG